MDRTAFIEPQFMYSTTIPLQTLWTVVALQRLSASRVQLYLYSPMRSPASTEYQYLYNTAIILLRLWDLRPLKSNSA